jgi:hypothetical protein
MTLAERYNGLTQPVTMFGHTCAPAIIAPLTVDKLKVYATSCVNSQYPGVKAYGRQILEDIYNAYNDLNAPICRPVFLPY